MRISLIMPFFLAVFLLASCSGSAVISPNLTENDSVGNQSPVYVSDWDSDGNPNQGMGVLGIFQGHIDTGTMTAELVPIRNSSTTDVIEIVDITVFLTANPCTNCVKLKNIRMSGDGYPILNIGIKHPFDAGDQYKPPTGRNRADLQVFNIEGIVATSSGSSTSFPGIGKSVDDVTLNNADGYTAYLDKSLDEILDTDADIHPYILHFADYSQGNFDPASETGFTSFNNPIPSGNLVMPMGSDYDFRDYEFRIENDQNVDFIFAVGCTYAITTSNKSQRFSPDYRIPQDNKKAASEVWVEIADNRLQPGVVTSDADLVINVLDINHGVPVGEERDEMTHDSSVSGISAEIPMITLGTETSYTFIGGDGRDPMNPLQFAMTIENSNGGGQGTYTGLVKVLDSYPPGLNEAASLGGKDGISRVGPLDNPLMGLFEISEFATYATFEIGIMVSIADPIAVIVTDPDPATVSILNGLIIFDGSSSYDPDGGSITLYEWDFDWDGDSGTFNPDITGTESVVEYNYSCSSGTYMAGLRVTDDDTPAGVSEIASVTILVTDDFEIGTFSDAIHLGMEYIRGDESYHTGQAIRVDSSNVAHIVTRDSAGIYHRTFDGITMSDRSLISGSPANARTVSCAIDGNDELHAGWIIGYGTSMKVQSTKTQSGIFTGVVDDLKTNGSADFTIRTLNMETNVDGVVMATWNRFITNYYPDCNYEYCVYDGSSWSAPELIPYMVNLRVSPEGASLMTSPNLVATPDGHFHQICLSKEYDLSYNTQIWDFEYDGTSWLAPVIAFDPSRANALTDTTACAGSDGSMHITGRNPDTNDLEYVRYDAGSQTWMPGMVITLNSHPWIHGPMGTIDISPSGIVYSTFVEENDELLHVKTFCQFWDQSAIQSAPDYVIDENLELQKYGHADAVWDSDGNLLIVSENDTGSFSYEVVFNILYALD